MEASSTTPAAGAAIPKADKPASTNGGKAEKAQETRAIPYLVFEAGSEQLKKGDTVTYLGRYTASDKQQARWAAVDADPELAKRTKVKAGEEGGAFLLAVAERMASPERTVEEVVETTIRR